MSVSHVTSKIISLTVMLVRNYLVPTEQHLGHAHMYSPSEDFKQYWYFKFQ